ncbi:hypothetical protein QMK17_24935 [Rhodococcus sp. G-MC3]|uniref:hypothetical protein n=1 Tax=Rhodococcus sp. G-MC3 TaxID=3046209 RepID=UPI0024B89772|nr:hypothetical protein [Rhodococcus sp. G-MC3]MDJ0396551.1 hypothetical protein [Rhodococcus sp. G-MC3]
MTSTAVRRVLGPVTIALGAFVAALALTTMASRYDALYADDAGLHLFYSSATSASALGSIVAVIIAATVGKPRNAFIAIGFGIVLLPVAILVDTPVDLHLGGLAAGLILGSCAALTGTRDRRILQCALVIGVVSAFAAAGPLESNRIRYSDYSAQTPQVYLLVLLGVYAALFVLSGSMSTFDASPARTQGTSRVLLVGIVIPVAGLVLYLPFVRSVASLGSGGAMQSRWLLGLAVVPLLVGAAFALPAVSGTVVLAALAYLATATGSFETSTAIVFVALLLAGTAVGWRWPFPLTGMGILVVVAAAALFADTPLEMIDTIAKTVLLPFATGLVFASLVPTTSPALTIAVTAPIAVSVPIVAEFGWTAYTPLTSIERTFSPSAWEWTSTAVSVLSVLAAGIGLAVLQRHRISEPQDSGRA